MQRHPVAGNCAEGQTAVVVSKGTIQWHILKVIDALRRIEQQLRRGRDCGVSTTVPSNPSSTRNQTQHIERQEVLC